MSHYFSSILLHSKKSAKPAFCLDTTTTLRAFYYTEKNDEIILKLTVSQDDMGKVIGKQGRIAKAIRTVVRSAANREKVKVSLEIV